MFKKKQALESIPLKLKLPEDGTYPPRILSPGYSLWLRGDSVTSEDITYIQNANNQWAILPRDKHEILVNGGIIDAETILSDGDYIRCKLWKGIFQADPVADYRKDIKEMDSVGEINPSEALRQCVILDYEQISLDCGEHFIRWDEIVTLHYEGSNKQWTVKFFVMDKGKLKTIPSKLKVLSNNDFSAFMGWITYHQPFYLSLYSLFTPIWSDAYVIVAHNKLLTPAEKHLRTLPETLDKILLVERSKREKLVPFIWAVVSALILSILVMKPNNFSSESVIRVTLAFGVIMGFFGIFLGLKVLENWYWDYKMRRLAKTETAANNTKMPDLD